MYQILKESFQFQVYDEEKDEWYNTGSENNTLESAIRFRDFNYYPRLDKRCRKPKNRIVKVTTSQEIVE